MNGEIIKVVLPPSLAESVKASAAHAGLSVSAYVRAALATQEVRRGTWLPDAEDADLMVRRSGSRS